MLAHAAHPYTASEARLDRPATTSAQDRATGPQSLDPSLHPSGVDFSPPPAPSRSQTDETVGFGSEVVNAHYIHGVPHHKQIQKSHSSAHRLVHPCIAPVSDPPPTTQDDRGDDGMLRGSISGHQADHVVYPFATTMAVPASQPIRNVQGSGGPEDIESGLGSGSSSGKSSTSSLVRGAGESVLAGIDWAGGKLAHLFGISQPKYQWAMDEHENLCKQAKTEMELNRLAKSARFFDHDFGP